MALDQCPIPWPIHGVQSIRCMEQLWMTHGAIFHKKNIQYIYIMIQYPLWYWKWYGHVIGILEISFPYHFHKKNIQYGLILYIHINQLDDMTYSSNIHPISNIIQYHPSTSPEIWAIHSRKNADKPGLFKHPDGGLHHCMVPDCMAFKKQQAVALSENRGSHKSKRRPHVFPSKWPAD